MSSDKDGQILALNFDIAKLERFKKLALSKYPHLEEEFKKSEDELREKECECLKKFCCVLLVILALFFIFLWSKIVNTKKY